VEHRCEVDRNLTFAEAREWAIDRYGLRTIDELFEEWYASLDEVWQGWKVLKSVHQIR